jgi:D-ribulokinase
MLSQAVHFIGIDLGTSGLRLLLVNEVGKVEANLSVSWPISGTTQNPQHWLAALRQLWQQLPPCSIAAVSVCSTSGTVLALDAQGQPVTEAWLYSDTRGAGHGIPSSWGLARWCWWLREHPEAAAKTFLAHPTDYLLTALGAPQRVTDHTCALKSGYDPKSSCWNRALALGIPEWQLPQVVRPGSVIGFLSPTWSRGEVKLVAGCTDGVAGQIASGALNPGQVCLALGSTLIFKGVSTVPIENVEGTVYSHLHPDGQLWLPGAASNCGGAILSHFFERERWDAFSAEAQALVPTGQIAYPLSAIGERFPIRNSDFAGSLPDTPRDSPAFWAGLLEGIAMVECLGIEKLEALGVPVQTLLAVGGGTRSDLWLRIRASLLNRPLLLPNSPEPAFGAAILAAAGYWQISVAQAAAKLVSLEKVVHPEADWTVQYGEIYQQFKLAYERIL